ncbi:MAG: hypothetical protein QF781_09620 [Phycisphaerales bacterium]|nr:hypothetical protein [Phycisphaerales bacterium]MDP6312396.1 hypothetical protein [Phycisphaerales bacterium]MDP7087569.1 hypothetical protein [Phycisphaerales bacterium]MDP7188972.1 hypothetical protein [Phycisphaerales bacterium]MDP7519332.1 hypothetical protein [Phycisphaerales bacterium]
MRPAFPLLTACMLLSLGCSTGRPGIKQSATTEDGRYRVTWWKTPPRPIEANDYFELYVQVDDLKTNEEPHDFRFDATMPAHRHGMNTVANPYRLKRDAWSLHDLNLHMPGEWVMTFDVTDQNGVLHRASETVILE